MSGLSDRLTGGKLRDLASLLLRAEHPAPSRRMVEPLLELVSRGEREREGKRRERAGEISPHSLQATFTLLSVLLQLVGERFDLKVNFLIKEPRVILLMLEALPSLSNELQVSATTQPADSTYMYNTCTGIYIYTIYGE